MMFCKNVGPVDGAVDCDSGNENSVASVDAVPLSDVQA